MPYVHANLFYLIFQLQHFYFRYFAEKQYRKNNFSIVFSNNFSIVFSCQQLKCCMLCTFWVLLTTSLCIQLIHYDFNHRKSLRSIENKIGDLLCHVKNES